ncbi:hypothetical protein OUZ56_024227 [Daphnia magna]|uniref:Uncharacterized protein n=1 Tax=Daphnia magna TaxID=35525 RepID=A0ABR0B0I7_9CRUS|nr:hypothetical protein OUZ56_024227 [Daphnia magna]
MKRTSFHSQCWHTRIHDIPEDELIFELQHHLEANGQNRLSDEHTRIALLFLLATGYTPILPRSYDSSSYSTPPIDAKTSPLRANPVENTEEWLIDVPTPDFAKPTPHIPEPTEFSPEQTLDSTPIEELPGKPTPHQTVDNFAPLTLTSSPNASPTMSHHHTLHPTPVSAPLCPASMKTLL